MTHEVQLENGEVIPFPDEMTDEQINRVLSSRFSVKPSMSPEKKQAMERFANATGIGRTAVSGIQDLMTGALRGGQHIAALLGEAGQAIGDTGARLMTGRWPKDVNIREEVGLGKDRPVDFQNITGPQNPNPAMQAIGQYGAGVMAGGPSVGGQAISNALYAGTQAQPDERNLFGMLPEGRPGAMIEGGLAALAPSAIMKVLRLGGSALNYLRPGKSATEFMQNLSNVSEQVPAGIKPSFANEPIHYQRKVLPTDVQNIEDLGKRMTFARSSAEQEALIPKKALFSTESGKNIFPSQKRSMSLIQNIAEVLKESPQSIDKQQFKEMSGAIRGYYNGKQSGDVENLTSKLSDTFNKEELTPHQSKRIEGLLDMEPLYNGKYLNLPEVDRNYKSLGLDEVHSKFKNNPTLKNSDELKQAIGREKRRLEEKIASKNYQEADRIKYRRLIRNEKVLLQDQENFFNSLPKEKQEFYRDFRTKWAANVPKYDKSSKVAATKKVISALSEGNAAGLTRQRVDNAFRGRPTKEIKAILEDLGPEGINNIIYNKLSVAAPGDAKALAEAIIKARRSGGYSHYITPEHEKFANDLIKRLKYQKITLGAGSALGLGLLGGAGLKLSR
jgi:hypothetical protein